MLPYFFTGLVDVTEELLMTLQFVFTRQFLALTPTMRDKLSRKMRTWNNLVSQDRKLSDEMSTSLAAPGELAPSAAEAGEGGLP